MGGFCTGIFGFLKNLLAKFASIKMRLLQAYGKLVSFVLILNFTHDIECLNLLSWLHLNYYTAI